MLNRPNTIQAISSGASAPQSPGLPVSELITRPSSIGSMNCDPAIARLDAARTSATRFSFPRSESTRA